MQIFKNKIGKDIVVYSDTVGYEVISQVKEVADFEAYQDSKIILMPDAHAGKGCTIGTTLHIKDKVTPNLVGVDIGCGVLAINLKNQVIDLKELDKAIHTVVPHGTNVHNSSMHSFDFKDIRCKDHVNIKRASLALGSLGGGNHFIEVAKGETSGDVYLIIHSGSRSLGHQVCTYYQDLAWKSVNEMKTVREELVARLKAAGREKDIASALKSLRKPKANKALATLEGPNFDDYMNDMQIVQRYAAANRKTIAFLIGKALCLDVHNATDVIHNYIDFRRNILRKGAISAEENEIVLIPMNMRDGTLLCKGKGNPDWNYSAPHGAGRLMSRNKARELLDLDAFKKTMEGIYTTSVNDSTLDEAPEAYKPMAEIVEAIEPTVEILEVLKPLYNFKDNKKE